MTVRVIVMVVVLVSDVKLMHVQKLVIIVDIAIVMENVNVHWVGRVNRVMSPFAQLETTCHALDTVNAKKNKWTTALYIVIVNVMLVFKEKDVKTLLVQLVTMLKMNCHVVQKDVMVKVNVWVANVIVIQDLLAEAVLAKPAPMNVPIMEDAMVVNVPVTMIIPVLLVPINVVH